MSQPETLDLRGTPCPINFVRTKMKLQQLPPRTVLEVWLDRGEPMEQVPPSLEVEGYHLQEISPQGDFFVLKVWRD